MVKAPMNSDRYLTMEQIEEQLRAIEEKKRLAQLRLRLVEVKAEKIAGFPHPSH